MTAAHHHNIGFLLRWLGCVIVTVCVILPCYLFWLTIGRWFEQPDDDETEDSA